MKYEMRYSSVVTSWPIPARHFWSLLWGECDDRGRCLDQPKTLAGKCFPNDEEIDSHVIDGWLTLFASPPPIPDKQAPLCRYEVAYSRLLHCINWDEHQHPNRPTPSRLPPCPIHESLNGYSPDHSLSDSHPRQLVVRSLGKELQLQRSEPLTESLNGLRAPPPRAAAAAAKIAEKTLTINAAEALAVVSLIAAERRPRSLGGLVRRLADDGELADWLARVRGDADAEQTSTAHQEFRAQAAASPPCEHGQPGGTLVAPGSAEPLCPLCRAGRRRSKRR